MEVRCCKCGRLIAEVPDYVYDTLPIEDNCRYQMKVAGDDGEVRDFDAIIYNGEFYCLGCEDDFVYCSKCEDIMHVDGEYLHDLDGEPLCMSCADDYYDEWE